MSEIALWGALKAELEVSLGTRLPVVVHLIEGKCTAEIGGLPGEYVLQPGGSLILDLVLRVHGYWGDNTDTHSIGDRSPELAKVHAVVHNALRRGVDAVAPGRKAEELDAIMRAAIRGQGHEVYRHHSGRGLGASYLEQPRIVHCSTRSVEPGIVIVLEPGNHVPDVERVCWSTLSLSHPMGATS
jgi:Xaa-Pro aminopeptidase